MGAIDLNLKRFLAYYGKIILMPEILMSVYSCTVLRTRPRHIADICVETLLYFWNLCVVAFLSGYIFRGIFKEENLFFSNRSSSKFPK